MKFDVFDLWQKSSLRNAIELFKLIFSLKCKTAYIVVV